MQEPGLEDFYFRMLLGKYAWETVVPMVFVGVTTLTSGILNVKNIYIPQTQNPVTFLPGLINLILTITIIACVIIILFNAVPKWIKGITMFR